MSINILNRMLVLVVLYEPSAEDLLIVLKNPFKGKNNLLIIDNSINTNIKFFKDFQDFTYCHFEENIGLSAAYNYGLEFCIKNSFSQMLIMDQDSDFSQVVPDKVAQEIIKRRINLDECGVIALRPAAQISRRYVYRSALEWNKAELSSGSIINVNIAEKIGRFDNRLFIDTIDCEYAFRLLENGYKTVRLNRVAFKHSIGTQKIVNHRGQKLVCYGHSALRRYYLVRNNLLLRNEYLQSSNPYIVETVNYSYDIWLKKQILLIAYEDRDRLLHYYYVLLGFYHFNNQIFGKIPEQYVINSSSLLAKIFDEDLGFLNYSIAKLHNIEFELNQLIREV
jgi:rhamnosyltransferase